MPQSENGQFFKATPWGSISMGTVNPAVAEVLKPGVEAYVDFTVIEPEAPASRALDDREVPA